ncbi:hypothetical protein CYJ76_05920 [Kytococcus schroeteri]|uniref:Peptidase S8/S53 domain-containing protein n=1 Tax=Kytococcus schroeteri TaxID=138300 RepID=A0A2I1PAY2_9MICO|nr:S8 family serine peptidase [Kytococcus schroeteri]PKZ41784.1 hypothetical protein CYJ76_05920 [Kytococcus schroeteri]
MNRSVAIALAAALATTVTPSALAAPATVHADGHTPPSTSSTPATSATHRTTLEPRTVASSSTPVARTGQSRTRIQFKLAEGTSTTQRTSALAAEGPGVVSRLTRSGALRDVRPMVDAPASSLRSLKATAEQRSGAEQADMSLWMVARVDAGSRDEVLRRLQADPAVEAAMPQPLPVTPPEAMAAAAPAVASPEAVFRKDGRSPVNMLATADFSGRQTYRGPASQQGIEALAVNKLPGGKGENVAVSDVEFGWTMNHEDLSQLARSGALIATGTPSFSYPEHGTAVMGEVIGDENGSGVTGIAPKATGYVANAVSREYGFSAGAAITRSAQKLQAGDVILLEQQLTGCGGGFAPVEIDPAAYDAIRTAVAKGIHVVEAAGNGAQNLDSSCYGGTAFPGGRGDSGAIIVGAGASSRSGRVPGSRLSYSTYGSRVNVQGWGEMVTTTGYGDLQGGYASTQYTDVFSGTSSASPIVTGAVALVSSVAQQKGVSLTPAQMRSLLVRTGTPQQGSSGHIGPLPNVLAAVNSLGEGTDPGTDPDPEPTGCTGLASTTGALSGQGDRDILPNGSWFRTTSVSTQHACLKADGEFALYLQKWNGASWDYVAKSTSRTGTEEITYSAGAGYYRWMVYSWAGSGNYSLLATGL